MPHGTATSQPATPRRTPFRRWGLVAALMLPTPSRAALAQKAAPVDRVPLVNGLLLGSVLHSPIGEREDLLEISIADTTGVHYAWHERTITTDGDTTTGFRRRFVSANDLAGAPRFDDIFGKDEQVRPGFTAVSLSSAVYRQLRDAGSARFSMTVYRQPPEPEGRGLTVTRRLPRAAASAIQGNADESFDPARGVSAAPQRQPGDGAGPAREGKLR